MHAPTREEEKGRQMEKGVSIQKPDDETLSLRFATDTTQEAEHHCWASFLQTR